MSIDFIIFGSLMLVALVAVSFGWGVVVGIGLFVKKELTK